MAYKSIEKRREHDRLYKRAWRARRKVEDAKRNALEAQRAEWEAARRLENLTPLVLTETLHVGGHTFHQGTVVRVQPGIVHRWQRALLADPVPQMEPVRSVRVIPLNYAPDIQPAEPESAPNRLPSGY